MTQFRRLSLAGLAALFATPATAQLQGPSSSADAYLRPIAQGVVTRSILTTGDSVGGYQMVGIPDGLGAFNNGDGTFTVLMNHELSDTVGAVRAHGNRGSFVSNFTVNASTLAVTAGRDQMTTVKSYTPGSGYATSNGTAASLFSRFCSADLASPTAYFNAISGLGTRERLFLSGEEKGPEGRAVGHVVTGANNGTTYELPALGKFSWENAVANPFMQDKTIVAGTDDATPGQVYFYVGNKTNTGTEVDRAGLTNGLLYGLSVQGVATENRTTGIGGSSKAFALTALGNATDKSGSILNTESIAAGVTNFLRPEDGAWDPSNPNNFYFVTTDRYDQVKDGVGTQVGRSRLWQASFADAADPLAGGTISLLLDGSSPADKPYNMFDNMAIDKFGHILLTEDVGGQAHNSKIWQYDIRTGGLTLLAQHDPARFGDLNRAPTGPFTNDEESSGIIDASDILGAGWFLIDVQAHYANGPILIEGGQLLAFFNPSSVPEPSSVALLGLGLGTSFVLIRRRRLAQTREV